MAGLVPAIHDLFFDSWMPGTSPGHDEDRVFPHIKRHQRALVAKA
jgi:hypothetical protein